MKIKPVFIVRQAWTESLLASLGGFILVGIYPAFGLLLPMMMPRNVIEGVVSYDKLQLWAWPLLILSLIIPALLYVHLKKKNYEQTYYEFGDNTLIYFDGFFTLQRKEIFYKKLIEISLRQNIVQRRYNVGTIILVDAATGMQTRPASSGIKLRDIENPETVYEQVRTIVTPHILQ